MCEMIKSRTRKGMNISLTQRYSLRSPRIQSGKALLILVVGIVSATVGVFAFTLMSNKSGGDQNAQSLNSSSNSEQLAELQESLQTSLALPADFRTIQAFELEDANGEIITQEAFEDQWSLVFFGFTHCPDVCPVTLQIMKDVVADLEQRQQEPPQIVFVSIDPVRDTAEVMKKYIAYFDENFVGITGELKTVHELSSSLGIVASFTANADDPENYGVDHTASLLLIDPQRRVRAKVTPPHEADKIVADLLKLTAAPS